MFAGAIPEGLYSCSDSFYQAQTKASFGENSNHDSNRRRNSLIHSLANPSTQVELTAKKIEKVNSTNNEPISKKREIKESHHREQLSTTNGLLPGLPREIKCMVTEYLTINDLSNCFSVSHTWKNLFDSDVIWEPIAKKFKVKKKEINSAHRFLIETPKIFNWIPSKLKNYLSNNYKNLIHQRFLLEENNIQKKHPKEFSEVFGGARAIRRLPSIEITFDELIHENNGLGSFFRFKDEHFSSPIVRATLKRHDNSENCYMLFRIINNETGAIYRDAISFFWVGMGFFENVRTKPEQRVICPHYCYGTKEKLNRLQRLIQRKPVGVIVEDTPYTIVEGEKTTADKKSVLELC